MKQHHFKAPLSKLAIAIALAQASTLSAAPQNGSIESGSASISGDINVTIDQGIDSGDTVTISWDSFDVAASETVTFIQHADDVAINNIGTNDASQIFGTINAGGTVILSNANGFVFGANSSINTGSFLATTSNVSLNGDELNLTTPGLGNIQISDQASIVANQGYLAFIGDTISTTAGDQSGKLEATNGSILFSNDSQGTIKLAGLDINISAPETILSGADKDSTMSLEGLDLNASNALVLTGYGLVRTLNSVINSPNSISATDLIIDSNGDEDTSITQEAFSVSLESAFKNTNNSIDNVTIDVNESNLTLDEEINLNTLTEAHTISLISDETIDIGTHNIIGQNINLNLTGKGVNLGSNTTQLGGNNGLMSLNVVSGANGITFGRNILTDQNITFDGNVTYNGTDDTPYIWATDGNISFNGDLTTTDTNNLISLEITGESLTMGSSSDFGELILQTQNGGPIHLNGDITSEAIQFSSGSEIILNESISLSASDIELDSNTLSGSETLTLIATDNQNNSFKLEDLKGSGVSGPLTSIIIKDDNNSSDSRDIDIILSGTIDAEKFCIVECNSALSNIDANYNLDLKGDTTFSGINILDLSLLSSLSEDYLLDVTGKDIDPASSSDDPQAIFSTISNLGGLTITDMNSVTFNGNVDTLSGGLDVTANEIALQSGSSITFTNTESGDIKLNGVLDANGSDLTITTTRSDVTLSDVTDFNNLTISNELLNEGGLTLTGSLTNGGGDISIQNIGNVLFKDSDTSAETGNKIDIETLGSFSSTDSTIVATSQDVKIDAIGGINLNTLSANNIYLFSKNTALHGNILSEGDLFFYKDQDNGGIGDGYIDTGYDNTLTLHNNLTLQGNLDLLNQLYTGSDTPFSPIVSGENYNLNLTATNEDIYLNAFTQQSTLNALSITGSGATVHYEELPNVTGIEGFSLLGDIVMNVGNNGADFNTADFNGNLDFSGVSIIGGGKLSFNTGTGELSLGNIGVNQVDSTLSFESLTIGSTGRLNLHGDIVTSATIYDFSSVNAIQLYADQTFGSEETPVEIDFGDASINGTYSLTLYSDSIEMGTIGNNIKLQDLTIVSTKDQITLDDDITLVGSANIQAQSLKLDNVITNQGLGIDIQTAAGLEMTADAELKAIYGDVNLTSDTSNIGLGYIYAGGNVSVSAETGYIYNAIGDYQSNQNTSINIESTNQNLYGLLNVGQSVDSPIVINVLNSGTISAESTGSIYIANLANAKVESDSRVIDSANGGTIATTDALSQFNVSSLNTVNLPTVSSTLGLISNLTWQVDEEESIRRIRTPVSSPAIYYSRKGWKLGQ